jgi:hypothetical protein
VSSSQNSPCPKVCCTLFKKAAGASLMNSVLGGHDKSLEVEKPDKIYPLKSILSFGNNQNV